MRRTLRPSPTGRRMRETVAFDPILSLISIRTLRYPKIMASRSVNKVTLIGHLGRDAETAYTASQTAVTKFSVATNRRWKDQQSGEWKEETNWTNVVLSRGGE